MTPLLKKCTQRKARFKCRMHKRILTKKGCSSFKLNFSGGSGFLQKMHGESTTNIVLYLDRKNETKKQTETLSSIEQIILPQHN